MKSTKKIVIILFVLTIFTMNTVSAEMKPFTVVLGKKAFSIQYANNLQNRREILEAMKNSKGKIFIKLKNDSWINSSGEAVGKNVIPKVVYKNGKEEIEYEAGDKEIEHKKLNKVINLKTEQYMIGTNVTVELIENDIIDVENISKYSIHFDGVKFDSPNMDSSVLLFPALKKGDSFVVKLYDKKGNNVIEPISYKVDENGKIIGEEIANEDNIERIEELKDSVLRYLEIMRKIESLDKYKIKEKIVRKYLNELKELNEKEFVNEILEEIEELKEELGTIEENIIKEDIKKFKNEVLSLYKELTYVNDSEDFDKLSEKIWKYLHKLDELKEYKFVDKIENDIKKLKSCLREQINENNDKEKQRKIEHLKEKVRDYMSELKYANNLEKFEKLERTIKKYFHELDELDQCYYVDEIEFEINELKEELIE